MTKEEWSEQFDREYFAKERAEQAAKKAAMTKKEVFIEKSKEYFHDGMPYVMPISLILFLIFTVKYFKKITDTLAGSADSLEKSVISKKDFKRLRANDLILKVGLGMLGLYTGFMSISHDDEVSPILFLICILLNIIAIPYLMVKNAKLARQIFEKGKIVENNK
jgi:phosphatidylserine synthase